MLTTNQKEQLYAKLAQLTNEVKVEPQRNSITINNVRFQFPSQKVNKELSASRILSR
jgi:hypothetical protein